MDDAWTGKMASRKTLHPSPRPAAATALRAAANYTQPETSYLVHEAVDAVRVARDGVIIQPTLHNASQPSSRFAYWSVHSLSQISFDRLQRGADAFCHRMAMNSEPALLSRQSTLMRETQKVESVGPVPIVSFSAFDCIATELDQTRFPFV